MARTVAMYKDTDGGRINAPVPRALVQVHEAEGWCVYYTTWDEAADAAEGTDKLIVPLDALHYVLRERESVVPFWQECDAVPVCNCDTECAYGEASTDTDAYGNVAPSSNPFYALLDRMREIHDAKNADYAASEDRFRNFRQSENVGVPAHIGAFVRLSDKHMRAANLLKREFAGGGGPAVKDESVEDTLMDLAIYSLIVLQLHREYREGK